MRKKKRAAEVESPSYNGRSGVAYILAVITAQPAKGGFPQFGFPLAEFAHQFLLMHTSHTKKLSVFYEFVYHRLAVLVLCA